MHNIIIYCLIITLLTEILLDTPPNHNMWCSKRSHQLSGSFDNTPQKVQWEEWEGGTENIQIDDPKTAKRQ